MRRGASPHHGWIWLDKHFYMFPLFMHKSRTVNRPTARPLPQLNALFWKKKISFYRAMLCIRGTSHGPVSVCVCLSVSVTSRSSTKTAKRRITQTTHTIPQGLYFSDAKDLREIRPGSPLTRAPNANGVGQNQRLSFRQITGYISKTVQDRHIVSIKVE